MKGLIVLIVLVGVGIWATVQFGGFTGMDPAQQAAEFRTNVKPGMTWEQVVQYRAPKKFYPIGENGEGHPGDFNHEQLKDQVSKGAYVNGFNFKYTFSGDEQYQVDFDSSGTVTEIEKLTTFNDLATGKTWQN